jgi:hypothetical protein
MALSASERVSFGAGFSCCSSREDLILVPKLRDHLKFDTGTALLELRRVFLAPARDLLERDFVPKSRDHWKFEVKGKSDNAVEPFASRRSGVSLSYDLDSFKRFLLEPE